jgi:hypothetical protein
MSCINKLIIFSSAAKLAKSAANYPCLVNYNAATQTGNSDDGCGHYANMTFAAVTCKADLAKLPAGPFDNIELIGFAVPTSLALVEE